MLVIDSAPRGTARFAALRRERRDAARVGRDAERPDGRSHAERGNEKGSRSPPCARRRLRLRTASSSLQ
jgi:hypothetical protein